MKLFNGDCLEIMKDIEQWDPRFDVEVFNKKGYFTILKRLSL